MKRKPRIIEVVLPEPVVLAAHLSGPTSAAWVPPAIPASIALARAREEALAVQVRVEQTPIWDAVVQDQGWNPRT